VRGDHARKGRSHFRAQRNGAFALVREVVELADDFFAALGRKKFERFERRAVVFAEIVTPGRFAPFIENEPSRVGAPSGRRAGAVRDKNL